MDNDLLEFGKDQDWKDYWTSGRRHRDGFNPHRFYWDYGWYGWDLGDTAKWNIDAYSTPDKPQNCLCVHDSNKMKDEDCDDDGENKKTLFYNLLTLKFTLKKLVICTCCH